MCWIRLRDIMIKVKKLHPNATVPTYGSEQAAGLDLYALDGGIVPAFGRLLVPTGIGMVLPKGTAGLIWPRSKLSNKYGIDVLAGVVDSDYRGDIGVILSNTSAHPFKFDAGDRIAQMVVQKVDHHSLEVITALEASERGEAGIHDAQTDERR